MSLLSVPLPASTLVAPKVGSGSLRHRAAMIVVMLLGFAGPRAAAAQTTPPRPGALISTGILAGVVEDSLGSPVAGARASLLGLSGYGTSEADGTFRLAGIQPGGHTLLIRRIGFRPESLVVEVSAGVVEDVRVRLRQNAQWVAPVLIEARTAKYTGALRAFYERRQRGMGIYFTAENIEERNPRVVTDLLRTIPGTRVVPRGSQQVVTFRDTRCLPLIWIDGTAASAGYLDPDMFDPATLAGIEVYKGVSSVPGALMGTNGKGSCGVIAIWTKRREPTPKAASKPVTAEEISNLIASLRLYTADDVEVPAASDPSRPIAPVYPDALLSEGIAGRVVAEFVVDTAGQADMSTFGTITTTHPLFTEAVRRAIAGARFTPATLEGRRVRQLVQLPFAFIVPKP